MKVRKIQRLSLSSSILSKTCVQLCYSVINILLMICLMKVFHIQSIHVTAYINATDTVNQFNQMISTEHYNSYFERKVNNRSGKFLFDSFFDINQPAVDAVDFEDDDDEEETKPCKCGNTNAFCTFCFDFVCWN